MPIRPREYVSSKHLLWVAVILISALAGMLLPFVEPAFLAVGVIAVINIVLVLKYPMWGLLLYLIVFLYRPGEVYPSIAAVRPELMLGILVVAAIFVSKKLKTGTFSVPGDTVSISLFAFLLVLAATVFTSYWRDATVDTCVTFVKTLVFYYMIVAVIDNRKKFVAFVAVYCVMIGKVAYDSLKLYLEGTYIHTMGIDRLQGATSFGGDPNSLANTMAVSIPLLIAAAMYFRNRMARYSLVALAVGTTYLIAITGSRGGLLSFFAVLAAGFIYARHKVLILIAAVVIVAGGWYILPEQYKDRYKTMTEIEDIDETSSGRWEIWKSGLHMIVSRPILGVGAGAFAAALGSGDFGRARFMQPHNLYIEVMATTGILGFAAWFGFFIYSLLKRLLKITRELADSEEYYWMSLFGKSFLIAMVSLFVSGMFGHNLLRFNWYMMAGLTVAMYNMALADNKWKTVTEKQTRGVEAQVS